jgi:hypothetical protein
MPRPIRRIVETFIVSLPLLNQDLLGSILAALYRLALTVRTSAGRAPFLRTRASAKPSRRIRSDGSKRRSHFFPRSRPGKKQKALTGMRPPGSSRCRRSQVCERGDEDPDRVRLLARNQEPNSIIYNSIPYASEQGIYFGLAGN